MRIGIFETSHFEVTYTLIRLFDVSHNKIILFTYEETARQLKFLLQNDAEKYQWEILPEGSSKQRFILHTRNIAKQAGLQMLVLSSAENNFIFYGWLAKRLPGIRILLTIHDINNYFEFRSNGTLRRYIRNTGKKFLIRNIREFTVLNSTMEASLRLKLPKEKIVRTIPGAYFDENRFIAPAPPHPFIHITVPGTIDVRRRDYEAVFALLASCNEKQIPVRVTLLGGFPKPYGESVLEQVKEYASRHHNLYWYDTETVDQPEFDKVMQETHFIFSPTRIRTTMSDDVTEQYGLTKSSGNIGDMIRFAKPAFMPEALVLAPAFSHSVIKYADIKEIPELLLQIRDQPEKYIAMQERALEASLQFTLEKIRAAHPDVFF